MGTRIYVGNLPYSTTRDALRDLFLTEGWTVRDVHIPTDRDTGRSRGFGFVELGADEQVAQAIDRLNGTDMSGRQIHVKEARERTGRPKRAGRAGGPLVEVRNGGRQREVRRHDARARRGGRS